jgi:hypothetical protein
MVPHPMANIKNMLNRIGDHKSKFFGKIDLTQGYHQCSVTLATMVLTAVIVFCGICEFTRLPFGPKKAPAHFQEQMAACVLLGLIYFICEVYLDDIIVHGKTSAEFLFRLREVFKRLRKFKLTVKPSKCFFGMPKVEYCGREISELGLSMSEKKCQTINNFPEPKLAQGLKSFLGMVNYFRGLFLTLPERNASTLTKPLSESASKMLLLQDNILLTAKRSLQVSDSIRIASYMDNQSKTEYAADSYVLVKHRTGQPPTRMHTLWKGPLRVISTSKSLVLLWDIVNNKEKTYHVTDLKQFYFDPLKTDPVDIARRDYLEFFIEEILDHKGNFRKLKSLSFLVRWRGYSPEFDKWEPWENLRETEQLHRYLIDINLSRLIPKQFQNNYV